MEVIDFQHVQVLLVDVTFRVQMLVFNVLIKMKKNKYDQDRSDSDHKVKIFILAVDI